MIYFPIGFILTFLPIIATAYSPATQLISDTDQSVILEFTLPAFTIHSHEQLPCQQIQIENWATTTEIGLPELPITGTLIQVPPTGKITVQVLEQTYYDTKMTMPCLVTNSDHISETSEFYPTNPVKMTAREIWRDIPVARLLIQPFQWQATTRTLRYFEKMRVKVQFSESLYHSSHVRSQTNDDHPFSSLLRNILPNYRPLIPTMPQVSTRDAKKTTNVHTNAVLITIDKTGIYRLSYETLQAAGVPLQGIKPEKLQLFNQETEIAITVVAAQPDRLQAGDYLLFYAQALDTEFTEANSYWLRWRTKGKGKRIVMKDAATTGKGNEITTFFDNYRIEENHELWQGVPTAPQDDYWFWTRLDAPQSSIYREYEFLLPHPVIDQTLEATVNVMFQGRSTAKEEPNHHTIIRLNGQMLSDILWSNDITYLQKRTVQQNLFKNNNLLAIELPGDTSVAVDTVYFNWLEIAYWRYLAAIQDNLLFTLHDRGELRIAVSDFTTPKIQLYDVTNPKQPIELKEFSVKRDEEKYTLIFENQQKESHTYYATTTTTEITTINNWQPTGLKSIKNGADYIIITDEIFLSEVTPLLAWREQQGLRVKAVSIQAIMNEFNDGILDPIAIKNFLTYAYENWARPAPTYVFLVGDASVDYRHYLPTSFKENHVPVHFSTETRHVLASDDNWYVAVQGSDVLPEMLIGRVPSANAEEVAAIVEKIVHFESNGDILPYKTLLISDAKEEYKTSSDTVATYLPEKMEKVEIWLKNYSDYNKATEDIISEINQGVGIVNYTGHGAVEQWGFTRKFFGLSDIQRLTNTNRLPFVIALSCANGHFAMPDSYSLSEEFMKTVDKGAIASFSPSRLSFYTGNQILAEELFARLFQPLSLGEITTGAKVAAYAKGTPLEFMKMYMLFGDPASQLRF